MLMTYFLLFLSLSTWAQAPRRIQVIPDPKTLEDFDHQFRGCPQNSECDQVMGHMLTRWNDLITKLKSSKDSPQKKARFVELFRGKYGIPVEFYTTQKSQQGFKPALHSSPCKEHNPKPPGEKTLRGTAFVKSIDGQRAVIWRDQAQIELPLEGNLTPQPVIVYYETGAVAYQLALNDQPLFIKNKELFILREDNDFYYMLGVSPKGDWKIHHVDFSRLSQWEDKRVEVACPHDKEKAPAIFTQNFCKSVWDESSKKLLTVKMHQGCSI